MNIMNDRSVLDCRYDSMESQVNSLPSMIGEIFNPYLERSQCLIDDSRMELLERLYLFGSGDSNFVGITAEFAFEQFASIPMHVMTSLKFSRYSAPYLSKRERASAMAIGISVSGSSSRAREGLITANKNDIRTIALSSKIGSFTDMASYPLVASLPNFPDPEPNGTPGIRSFVANQLMLLLVAIRLGLKKQVISQEKYEKLIEQLEQVSCELEKMTKRGQSVLTEVIDGWKGTDEYVFVGSGPSYGSALFSAAKFIEASGDFAIAQETEEWAHLNYYNRKKDTPTIVISSGKNDYTRTCEIVSAAKEVGRRVMLLSPDNGKIPNEVDLWFELPNCDESVLPIYTCAVTSLMASYRSKLIGETYFRENNTVETSRIRTSELV